MKDRLDALARAVLGDLAHAGIGVARGAETAFGMASAPGLARAGAEAPFRVASISKIVTGQVAARVFGGAWDSDLSDCLGFELRPDGLPVTLGQVLSHRSGLSDAGGYALDPRLPLDAAMRGAVWNAAPGARFEYCNLGYILVAAAVEARSGRPFGAVARDLGLPFAFNWFGTDPATRARALPVFRRGAGGFVPQIDATPGPREIERGDGTGLALSEVRNASAWSPQGGLRASLADLLALARLLPGMEKTPLWSTDATGPAELWDQYGAGLMILRRPAFHPRPLLGHFANAYGLAGGVWHDAEAGISFAYALNGLAEGDEDDALRPAEHRIFEAIARLAP